MTSENIAILTFLAIMLAAVNPRFTFKEISLSQLQYDRQQEVIINDQMIGMIGLRGCTLFLSK